jgi:hypothetical protein
MTSLKPGDNEFYSGFTSDKDGEPSRHAVPNLHQKLLSSKKWFHLKPREHNEISTAARLLDGSSVLLCLQYIVMYKG